jgi:hypothetical protein
MTQCGHGRLASELALDTYPLGLLAMPEIVMDLDLAVFSIEAEPDRRLQVGDRQVHAM